MSRTIFGCCTLLMTLLMAQSAWAQTADRHSAAKLLPPGDYQCKMGSYSFRDCTIEQDGDGVALVIPDGLGHFMAFRAELLASDDKNELTLMGKMTARGYHCGGTECNLDDPQSKKCPEPVADRKACFEQPLIARLKVSGDQASGSLNYYIMRSSPESANGFFKLGNKDNFIIRKKKSKK